MIRRCLLRFFDETVRRFSQFSPRALVALREGDSQLLPPFDVRRVGLPPALDVEQKQIRRLFHAEEPGEISPTTARGQFAQPGLVNADGRKLGPLVDANVCGQERKREWPPT